MPSEAILGGKRRLRRDIINRDPPPVAYIFYDVPDSDTVATGWGGPEGAAGEETEYTITLLLTGETQLSMFFSVAVEDSLEDGGSYTSGDDLGYQIIGLDDLEGDNGRLCLGPCGGKIVSRSTFSILVKGDNWAEPTQYITFRLENPLWGVISRRYPSLSIAIENDDSLHFSLRKSSDPVVEGDQGDTSRVGVTVALASLVQGSFTMDYAISGTATNGVDYQQVLPTGTIAFGGDGNLDPDQVLSHTLYFDIIPDLLVETDETIVLSFGNVQCTSCVDGPVGRVTFPGWEAVRNVQGATIITIEEDDFPEITIISPSLLEGGPDNSLLLDFIVELSAVSPLDIVVRYSIEDGTATAGRDYVATDGDLLFTAGQTLNHVSVTINGDDVYELDETITATLSNPVAAIFPGGASTVTARGVIVNDDPPPVITLTQPASVTEGDTGETDMVFTITKTGLTEVDSTVTYSLTGSAVSGVDYTPHDRFNLTIPASVSSIPLTVVVLGDNLAEPNETVDLTLALPYHAHFMAGSSTTSTTGTIIDDEVLLLAIDSPQMLEGNAGDSTVLEFTVTMSARADQVVSVDYFLTHEGGTATEGADYSIQFDPLVFSPGETVRRIPVTLVGDSVGEANETIEIDLLFPTCTACAAAGVIQPEIETGLGVATIINDDGTLLSIDSPSVDEGNAGQRMLTFTVSVGTAPTKTIRVQYAVTGGTASVAGGDYIVPTGNTLTFPANVSTPRTIQVAVFGDSIYEADETLTVSLSTSEPESEVALFPATGTGTIRNDDVPPLVTIDSPIPITEGDTGSKSLEFLVTKSGPTELDATIEVAILGTATSPSDYVDVVGGSSLTFGPAETTKAITLTVIGDSVAEPDETVIVSLSGLVHAAFTGGGSTLSGRTSIQNDDGLQFAIDSPSIDEGQSGTTHRMTFTVTLDAEFSQQTSVSYSVTGGTATAGEDYQTLSPGTLTFAPAVTSQTIDVTVVGDLQIEGSETVIVTLANPTCTSCAGLGVALATISPDHGVGTGTIVGDDQPLLSIDSPSVMEGDSGQVSTLEFTVTMTQRWHSQVSVDYSVTGGTATAGEDYRTVADGTLIFVVNTDTQSTISVDVLGDGDGERDETLVVTLSNPINATIMSGVGTGTIRSDDRSLSIRAATPSVTEGEDRPLEFLVEMDPPADSRLMVDFEVTPQSTATVGADFESPSFTQLVFERDESSKSIMVMVKDDSLEEDEEFVEIALVDSVESASITTATARGAIIPRRPAGGSVLSVARLGPTLGSDGTGPTTDMIFRFDPPRNVATSITYIVRLSDPGVTGSGRLGIPVTVTVPADQREFRDTYSLGPAFNLEHVGLLVVEVVSVSVEGETEPDPLVNIRGLQDSSGRALVGHNGEEAGRLAVGMRYVLSGAGRAVAASLVETVWERAEAYRYGRPESTATVGGRRVDVAAFAHGDDPGRAAGEVARLLGIETSAPSARRGNSHSGSGFGAWRDWAGLPGDDLARGTRFSLTSGDRGVGMSTVWGRGDFRSFENVSDNDDLTVEGDTDTLLLGFDHRYRKNRLVGVTLSRASGDVSYVFGTKDEGSMTVSLTTLAPWFHRASDTGGEAWGIAGIGMGTAGVEESGVSVDTDVRMLMLAFGLRGKDVLIGNSMAALKADAFMASLSADAADGDLRVAKASADTHRLRLALELAGGWNFESGGEFAGLLDVGARSDGGDGASGSGMDAILGFRMTSGGGGLEMTGKTGILLSHSQEGYDESFMSFALALDPSGEGRGIQLSLEPALNAAAIRGSGYQWNAAPDGKRDAPLTSGASLRSRLGYGLRVMDDWALATAYGQVESGEDQSSLRLGAELRGLNRREGGFTIEVYGQREAAALQPDDALMLEGRFGI